MEQTMSGQAQTQNEQKKEALSTFRFQGNQITFKGGETVMVNATEMAKPFGKVPKDWLRLQQAQDFIASLSAVRQICPTGLIKQQQGGIPSEQGTWMHEDVAMEFARWLSPEFGIWCNDIIKELLLNGRVEMAQLSHTFIRKTTRLLESAENRIDSLQRKVQEQKAVIAGYRAEADARKKLPHAARHAGFMEWQAQVRRYVRSEDRGIIADLYGCTRDHVNGVLAGRTVSMPLSRIISEYAEENCRRGIRADEPYSYETMLFTESELAVCQPE